MNLGPQHFEALRESVRQMSDDMDRINDGLSGARAQAFRRVGMSVIAWMQDQSQAPQNKRADLSEMLMGLVSVFSHFMVVMAVADKRTSADIDRMVEGLGRELKTLHKKSKANGALEAFVAHWQREFGT